MRMFRLGKLGLQLRSLRGGGTVWRYELTDDLKRVQWRGRWQSEASLAWYLQGALILRSLAGLSGEAQRRLLRLERLDPAMLRFHP